VPVSHRNAFRTTREQRPAGRDGEEAGCDDGGAWGLLAAVVGVEKAERLQELYSMLVLIPR
jgi:hypothetical protein